jgi:hypothetical protein
MRRSRWTPEEDNVLINQIKVHPQNLKRCFELVAEDLDRSPSAVANHWYTVVSKKKGVEFLCFGTVTPQYFSKNRKNSMGVDITNTIWRRFCNLVRNLLN